MFCENCGKKIPDDAVFCTHCGAKQMGAATLTSTQTASAQNYQPSERVNLPPVQKIEISRTPQRPVQSSSGVDLISLGQYLIMMIVMAIPIVGIIMMFVWAFSSDAGPNKKNFARAMLIMMGIGIMLGIIMSIVMAAITASMMSTLYY